jgi:hypothetical protein
MSQRKLYEVYEYTCDLCGFVWQPSYWADNAAGGSCTIVEDGINGAQFLTWKNLCRSCRKEIQDAVRHVRDSREKRRPALGSALLSEKTT